MLKDKNGKVIFTADDAIEWLTETCEFWTANGNGEEETEGLRWAIETIKYRQAEARKAEEGTDHV